MEKGPEVEPTASTAKVMPIFPLRTIEWPGSVVQLKVIEPAHQRLYQDFLMKGSRYLFAPLAMLPWTGEAPDDSTPAEQRKLCTVGAVLKMTELKEVSEETDGAVKYKARHTVVGRARLNRILNPSAAFEVDNYGAKIDFLRGEVELMHDDEIGLHAAGRHGVQTSQIGEAWEEIRGLAEQLDEPRLENDRVIWDAMNKSSTWQIANLWARLQQNVRRHRDATTLISEVQHWIKTEQDGGRLPQDLPEEMDPRELGMPEELLRQVMLMQRRQMPPLDGSFYEPLLEVLAAETVRERGVLLLKMAQDEVKSSRARLSLQQLLG